MEQGRECSSAEELVKPSLENGCDEGGDEEKADEGMVDDEKGMSEGRASLEGG